MLYCTYWIEISIKSDTAVEYCNISNLSNNILFITGKNHIVKYSPLFFKVLNIHDRCELIDKKLEEKMTIRNDKIISHIKT